MARKLPLEAFQHYVSLGTGRSYQAVADHFRVCKSTVSNRARDEGWQARLEELDKTAREQFEKHAVKELELVRERQLKGARALQAKALEALRDLPAERGIRAGAALSIAWKHELLLLGEPTERNASVEEVTKREIRELLVVGDRDTAEEDWSEFEDDREEHADPAA